MIADGIRLRVVANRLHTKQRQRERDTLRDLPEQAVYRVDGALFAHTRLQLLIVYTVVDHRPRDQVEHTAARLDEHEPDDVCYHARGVAGDGDAQHDDGRDDAQEEGHPDGDFLAELRHDLGRERQEEDYREIRYDGADGDEARVLEMDLEEPLGGLRAGHEEDDGCKRRKAKRKQRSVVQEAFQRLEIVDLLTPLGRHDYTFRRHPDAEEVGDERDDAQPQRHPYEDVAHQVFLLVVKQEGEQHADAAAGCGADGAPRRERSPLKRIRRDGCGEGAVRHVHQRVANVPDEIGHYTQRDFEP